MSRNRLLIVSAIALLVFSIAATVNTRAIAQLAAITACATTTACIGGTNSSTGPGVGGTNTSTGPGVLGTGANGSGVRGTTAHNSTGPANATYGVYGQDVSTTGSYDIGVKGLSVRGIGTSGQSTSNLGVRGISSTSYGVSGTSTSATGVFGTSGSSIGTVGTSTSYISVYGSAGYIGTYGNGTSYGSYGFSGSGRAVDGASSTGTGVYASTGTGFALEAHSSGGLAAYVTNSNGNGGDVTGSYIGLVARSNTFPLVATNSSGGNLFYVDGAGNVFYHGSLSHFASVSGGATVTTFGAQSATPAMEDTGTARLIAGQATVALDPAFAASIDTRRVYQVFLTPGADTRGLYVASKSPTQFVVREVQGGRGSFAFDYHIYATEIGRGTQRITIAGPNAKALRVIAPTHPAAVKLPR